ncbi:helix-turn-helix domain-containing protein [Actinopolyspora alba]|uniref:helix-turn-helix domain-containing protein n=1 Tax=Actinopolyspora alba TaxID=673379 RepID=UPI000B833C1C|nr:helix-turn-helix transcriptional regulator [Actinopolyspora alba]
MTGTRPGSPKARTLGAELRKARESTGTGVRELARKLNIGHAWITRTETGVRTATPEDVAGITVALGLSASERDRLTELARESDGPDWLRAGIPGVHQELVTLIEYERTASAITEVAPLLVPGLLQTADYARTVMATSQGPEQETRIAMRSSRRDILTSRQAPTFEAILMERALTERIAAPEIMADQLRHVGKIADLPNVTLRIIPSNPGAWTSAHSGQFMLIEFPRAAPIVHLEHLGSAAFLTAPHAVEIYKDAVGNLRDAAMTPEQAKEFVAARANDFEESIP